MLAGTVDSSLLFSGGPAVARGLEERKKLGEHSFTVEVGGENIPMR